MTARACRHFMLWVWCGSSHKTPGCALVCITLVLGCWQESFVVGCVIRTTFSEVLRLGYFVDVMSVGRLPWECLWRRFRAETLHPLQSAWHVSHYRELNIFLCRETFLFVCLFTLKGTFFIYMQLPPFYLLSFSGEEFHIIFRYFTDALSTCDWHVIFDFQY